MKSMLIVVIDYEQQNYSDLQIAYQSIALTN